MSIIFYEKLAKRDYFWFNYKRLGVSLDMAAKGIAGALNEGLGNYLRQGKPNPETGQRTAPLAPLLRRDVPLSDTVGRTGEGARPPNPPSGSSGEQKG